MATYKYFEASGPSVRTQAVWPILLALCVVPAAYLIPLINSTHEPYVDLTSVTATTALWLSHSASLFGATLLALLLILVMALRTRMSQEYRLKEALLIAGTCLLLAGGGALLNEHWIKKRFEVPRPNVEWLAKQSSDGLAGVSLEDFYAMHSKKQRREPLVQAITGSSVPISDAIKAHWIKETGYSFPSGHSFTAFFFATFFILLASTFIETRRRMLYYALIPWAVSVCYSRMILRVHTPLDVSFGALQGVIFGFIGWYIVRAIIRNMVQEEIRT